MRPTTTPTLQPVDPSLQPIYEDTNGGKDRTPTPSTGGRSGTETGSNAQEKFIRTRELAEILSVSKAWVIEKYADGHGPLPGYRLPGSNALRFRLSEVEATMGVSRAA